MLLFFCAVKSKRNKICEKKTLLFLSLQYLELIPLSTFLKQFHMKRIFHRKNAAQTFQNTCLWHKRNEDG